MGRYARNSIGQYAPVGAAADDLPGGATPTGKKTIDTTAEVDVASYATAQVVDENLTAANIKKDVEVLGITGEYEGGGIPAPTITATFVIPDYSDVTLLETYIVEEIEGSYQEITLTEVTQETTVITGLAFPDGYADYSVHWGISPYCSGGNDPYNVSVSNTVNCVADEFGTVEVTDITQPCSATFTFTKP